MQHLISIFENDDLLREHPKTTLHGRRIQGTHNYTLLLKFMPLAKSILEFEPPSPRKHTNTLFFFMCSLLIQGDDSDCRGHGTHCAGTIAGKVYGVAKQARLHAVRVLGCAGSGSWAAVINGKFSPYPNLS